MTLRLAILADVHGNLPAFEAALKHALQQKPDLIVLAGDIINGSPDSAACWQLAQSLNCPMLRGNHERYAAHYGTTKASPDWVNERFAPLHWTVAHLTDADRASMEALPHHLRLAEAPGLLLVHASLRDDHDTVEAHTTEERLNAMFPNVAERLIVRGHNHHSRVRLWEKGTIVTTGSVGLPLDGDPEAQYLLLDQRETGWRILHQLVPYNLEAAIQRFFTTGYLEAAGPVGRLYLREVATASYAIVPFLRTYERWSKIMPLSLSQGVERFLNQY
jgi:predicted phosphodiesterase